METDNINWGACTPLPPGSYVFTFTTTNHVAMVLYLNV